MSSTRNLGSALRYLRILSGRKQVHVARAAGITRAMLSDYERGSRDPSLVSLFKILDALDADLTVLHRALDVVTEESVSSVPPSGRMPGGELDLARLLGEPDALPREQRDAYEQIVSGFFTFLRLFHRRQKKVVEDLDAVADPELDD